VVFHQYRNGQKPSATLKFLICPLNALATQTQENSPGDQTNPRAAHHPVDQTCPRAAQKPVDLTRPKAAQNSVDQTCPRAAQKPVDQTCPRAAQNPLDQTRPRAAQAPITGHVLGQHSPLLPDTYRSSIGSCRPDTSRSSSAPVD